MKIRLIPSLILGMLMAVLAIAVFDMAHAQPLPPPGSIPGTEDKTPVGPLVVQRSNAGWHIVVYLRDSNGNYYDSGLSCPHGVCESWPQFASRMYALHTSADPKMAYANAWAQNVGFNCTAEVRKEETPRGLLCRERRVVFCASLPNGAKCAADDAPPPNRYAVKLNGTVTTRPVYAFDGTTRGTKEIGRASVGQPCSTSMPTLASGSDLWAAFGPTFEPGKVALCALVRE